MCTFISQSEHKVLTKKSNMKNILFIALSLFICTGLSAQTFPEVEAENLNGKTIHLPEDLQPKPRIVGIAFSQKAQDAMASWFPAVYTHFIDKTGPSSVVYDVEAYMLVVFTGAKKAASKKATKMIKDATQKEFYNRVLLHKGSFDPFRESLQISDKDEFYLFVVSPFGDIMGYVKGRHTNAKFDKLDSFLLQ